MRPLPGELSSYGRNEGGPKDPRKRIGFERRKSCAHDLAILPLNTPFARFRQPRDGTVHWLKQRHLLFDSDVKQYMQSVGRKR
jgi:hypothetical protein